MVKTTDMKGKDVPPMENTFWLDGFEGKVHSGYYIRSDLFKQIKRFEETGHKVIGIKVDPDSWNLEFICEVKDG